MKPGHGRTNAGSFIAWHSHGGGVQVFVNAIELLDAAKVNFDEAVLLAQPQDERVISEGRGMIERALGDRRLEVIITRLDTPTHHARILDELKHHLASRLSRTKPLHVNISPGTPAMHAAWIFLYAAGELPDGSKLWSTQKLPDGRLVLEPVELSIPKTYLAKVGRVATQRPDRPTYSPRSPSPRRREALERLACYARIPRASLLVLGERGTGKSRLIESHIPLLKQRKMIVTVPCGLLEPSLAESRLFGHEKGAFTGATSRQNGLVHKAQGQVLFFDEIQDLDRRVQRKLVRLLEEHKFARVGQVTEEEADIEVVFATNRTRAELREMLDPDLYDRLAMLTVEIPPLRECREAIREDWENVWRAIAGHVGEAPWTPQLEHALMESELLGNFRDLQRLAYEILAAAEGRAPTSHALNVALARWKRGTDYRPAHTSWPENEGPFGPGTYDERHKRFQHHLGQWAENRWPTIRDAARALNVTERTLRNWRKHTPTTGP
ncbi:MAG: hypothetical protein KatS3mg102_0714 [Planctomycetota bacterium]|nr:MAG: hypothetical protein KatS3mg102_0714 [Planctomycetota bacterium]